MNAPVALAIVAHEAAGDLPDCLAAVAALDPAPAEVAVVDCASRDGSAEVARRAAARSLRGATVAVVALPDNRGFAGGTNVAIASTASPWILTLNPDARPAPDFLARLLERAGDPRAGRVGAIAGRLARLDDPGRLDACGMRLTRAWRHLDRGAGEPERGQYARPERVFGATGAASLWQRAALVDVALDGAPFDERLHSFREDAELCLRLRAREWEVVYEPSARALHRRRVTPGRRRALPAELNRRSLANRYRIRLAHQSAANFLATLPWTLARDLAALAWVAVLERGSLAAYRDLWRERRELGARRAALRARRTAPPGAVERWLGRDGEPL
jgi:GT2 family glycosyltransferase